MRKIEFIPTAVFFQREPFPFSCTLLPEKIRQIFSRPPMPNQSARIFRPCGCRTVNIHKPPGMTAFVPCGMHHLAYTDAVQRLRESRD